MIFYKFEDKSEIFLVVILILIFGLMFFVDKILTPDIPAPQISLIVNF